jgi:hypothetical protein
VDLLLQDRPDPVVLQDRKDPLDLLLQDLRGHQARVVRLDHKVLLDRNPVLQDLPGLRAGLVLVVLLAHPDPQVLRDLQALLVHHIGLMRV